MLSNFPKNVSGFGDKEIVCHSKLASHDETFDSGNMVTSQTSRSNYNPKAGGKENLKKGQNIKIETNGMSLTSGVLSNKS